MSKKIRCDCGKWVARKDTDGNVFVWCKNCKKEVKVTEISNTVTFEKSKVDA